MFKKDQGGLRRLNWGQVKSDGAMRGIRGSRRIKSVQEGSRVFKKDQVGLSRLKWGQVK